MSIRKVDRQDVPLLKLVIDSSELFPSELLDGMMEDYFNNPSSTDIWLTVEEMGDPIAVAYLAPERLTEGTFNLYLIAVHKSKIGQGIGVSLISFIEQLLKERGERLLIVETSGLPEFELTRKFYDKCDFHREAVIRDFYRKGEDKVIFLKKLKIK